MLVLDGHAPITADGTSACCACRRSGWCAWCRVAFVKIDLPAMPSALVWRADDRRPILQELDALLLRIGRRYGIAPA